MAATMQTTTTITLTTVPKCNKATATVAATVAAIRKGNNGCLGKCNKPSAMEIKWKPAKSFTHSTR